jgi:hypothetical protein
MVRSAVRLLVNDESLDRSHPEQQSHSGSARETHVALGGNDDHGFYYSLINQRRSQLDDVVLFAFLLLFESKEANK